jgi:hypothetical protein
MRVIYKYDLQVTEVQTIELPAGAEILTVQMQHGMPQLWALIDPNELGREPVGIVIIGTGHPIDDAAIKLLKYINTFQVDDGNFIFHVFQTQN